MKNKLRLWLSIFLLCVMLASALPASAEATSCGLDFNNLGYYKSESKEITLPSTYEATVCLPTNLSGRGGVIIGNYTGEKIPLFNLEIHENGNPRIYINDKSLINYNVIFTQVDLRTGNPTHFAITVDYSTGTWSCYVDGVLKQTIMKAAPEPFTLTSKLMLGGDFRTGNAQYFKGTLLDLALYSDVRSAEEIAEDATTTGFDNDALICVYDLTDNTLGSYPDAVNCEIDSEYNFTYSCDWIKEIPEPEDYAYSFAVIGDIQTLTYYYPQQLNTLYDWIRDNADEKKIEFAIGLGDITDKNTDAEYQRVIQAYDKIDGVVPFSIIRGNHDREGILSARFDTYITQEKYGDEFTGAYDDTMKNTYSIVRIGSIKYLFMNLDYLLKDDVLDWANYIISIHPECHVIVSTHIYMSQTGSYYKTTGSDSPNVKYGCKNNGQGLWDKLLSKHENIVMLLCGHNPTDNIYYRQKAGDNGNLVTEILIDPQTTDKNHGGTGLVAMFYFSEDGRQLEVQYYSTVKDAYFKSNNQFKLTLDVPSGEIASPTETEAIESETEAPDTNTPDSETEMPETDTPAPSTKESNPAAIVIAAIACVLVVGAIAVFCIIKKKKATK